MQEQAQATAHILKRKDERLRTSPAARGRIMNSLKNQTVNVRTVDVSRRGLGLIIDRYIEPGTLVKFNLLGESLAFEVAWCQTPRFMSHDHNLRCGLFTLSDELDLVSLFGTAGCPLVKDSSESQGIQPPGLSSMRY